MKKRAIVSALLASMMAVSALAGCGDNNGSSQTSSEEESSAAETSAESSDGETAEAGPGRSLMMCS